MLLFRLPLFHSPFLYGIFNVGKCEIGYNSKNKEEYEGNKKKLVKTAHGSSLRLSSLNKTIMKAKTSQQKHSLNEN